MDRDRDDARAIDPQDDPCSSREAKAMQSEDEAASWIARFADSGPPLDPDRVWLQIATQLDEVQPPGRSFVVRAYAGARRAIERVARFASITGGGLGGPLFVGLFAILVIATLIAARLSEGQGLG